MKKIIFTARLSAAQVFCDLTVDGEIRRSKPEVVSSEA